MFLLKSPCGLHKFIYNLNYIGVVILNDSVIKSYESVTISLST